MTGSGVSGRRRLLWRASLLLALVGACVAAVPAAGMRPGRGDEWAYWRDPLVVPLPLPPAPGPPSPEPPLPPQPTPGTPTTPTRVSCAAGYNYAAWTSYAQPVSPFGATVQAKADPTINAATDHTLGYVTLGHRSTDTLKVDWWVQAGVDRGAIAGLPDAGHPIVYVEANLPSGYTVRKLADTAVGDAHRIDLSAAGTTVSVTVDGVDEGTFDLGVAANDASVAAEIYTTSSGACPQYDWLFTNVTPGMPTHRLGALPGTAGADTAEAKNP